MATATGKRRLQTSPPPSQITAQPLTCCGMMGSCHCLSYMLTWLFHCLFLDLRNGLGVPLLPVQAPSRSPRCRGDYLSFMGQGQSRLVCHQVGYDVTLWDSEGWLSEPFVSVIALFPSQSSHCIPGAVEEAESHCGHQLGRVRVG